MLMTCFWLIRRSGENTVPRQKDKGGHKAVTCGWNVDHALLINPNTPLIIKKGGPGSQVGDFDYTLNRLTGMCAAFAANQPVQYRPRSAMAVSLGLAVETDRKLYYAATPGAEHFPEIFAHKPLLWVLRVKQLSLHKVTRENIARIASVKNNAGRNLADLLNDNRITIEADLQKFTTGGSRGLAQ